MYVRYNLSAARAIFDLDALHCAKKEIRNPDLRGNRRSLRHPKRLARTSSRRLRRIIFAALLSEPSNERRPGIWALKICPAMLDTEQLFML